MAEVLVGLCACVHIHKVYSCFQRKKVLQSIICICVLCVFVLLQLGRPLSAFAVRHLPEGILWTGFRAAAGSLRPDELSSVLYRLVINC